MINAAGRKKTRAERLSMPLARDVVKTWPSSTAPASGPSN
jgi:hypothetical protein